MTRIVALLQCRDGSTRLPGKSLLDLNGIPIIEHIHRRLSAVGRIDAVVVSTSENSSQLIDYCQSRNWKYWAGPEEDLLARHLGAAMTYDADAILRVTGDCVWHDPSMLEAMVSGFLEAKGADALINWHRGNRTYSEGLDAEIVTVACMRKLMQDKNCPREDWMTFLDRSTRYKVMGWAYPERVGQDVHLSIDTPDDLARARAMMSILGDAEWKYPFTLKAWEMTK